MRILMLSWEYPPNVIGGLGRHVAELVPALIEQGVKIHVMTPAPATAETGIAIENGLTVHRVFIPTMDPEADVYNRAVEVNTVLERYIRETADQYGPFDLIHTHDWLTSFAAIALQKMQNCPLVGTIHATERGRSRNHLVNDLQRAIDSAEHRLVMEAQRVIVCSQHMANEVQDFFQAGPAKLSVIPNGVDLTNLRNGYGQDQLVRFRAKYAAPDEQIVFSVSRLVYEKGVHLLIDAAPRILAACPRTRIIIAGKGPEAKNLKRQAKALDVADRVHFIGFVSDEERNHLFKVADCSVFPSLYEPFGIVALEAMALGTPLVVSDVGGFSEVVEHAETGITIFPNDVDSTTWGVVQALTKPEWARQQTIKAHAAVERLFNWPRIARLTHELYRHVLDPPADQEPHTFGQSFDSDS